MSETANRNLPLVNPDQPQREGAARLNAALSMIDTDIAALLLAIGTKANAVDIGPAITAAINALVAGAPAALDTLAEVAAKLSQNDDAVAAIMSSLSNKANAANVYSRATVDGMVAGEAQARSDADAVLQAAVNSLKFSTFRPFNKQIANFNALAFYRYRCETGAGAITATLPASPADGDIITVRRKGANNVVVGRNSKTIAGLAEDLSIDADKREIDLKYNGTTSDWEVEARAYL